MKDIIGLIPAAGIGSRLYPYTGAKELLPIGSQSLTINGKKEERPKIVSQYVVEAMVHAGVSRIIFIISQHKDDLMKLYRDGRQYGIDICYLYQEKPQGMARALNLARNWVGDATVLLGMPDTVVMPKACFSYLLAVHRSKDADLTLGLFPTRKPYKFGMVKTDRAGRIIYHVDKPKKTNLKMMWGIACWERTFTDTLASLIESYTQTDREMVLGDVFDAMIAGKYRCLGVKIEKGVYYDIGTYDDYKRAVAKIK